MAGKVVEVDYYVLVEKIKRARDQQLIIEPKDKDKWKAYVDEHKVRQTSLEAFGKVKFTAGAPKLVAITMGDENWDGCYAYSTDDEAAIKFIPK